MRKTIGVVVLIIVIIAAIVFAVMSASNGDGPGEKEAKQKPHGVIDVQSLKMVSMPLGDWEALKPDKETGYRTDEQGRTLAAIITCTKCLERIPKEPVGLTGADDKARAAYICPKCKEKAYPRQ